MSVLTRLVASVHAQAAAQALQADRPLFPDRVASVVQLHGLPAQPLPARVPVERPGLAHRGELRAGDAGGRVSRCQRSHRPRHRAAFVRLHLCAEHKCNSHIPNVSGPISGRTCLGPSQGHSSSSPNRKLSSASGHHSLVLAFHVHNLLSRLDLLKEHCICTYIYRIH